ncbi:MAG TPA: hypothetical protein DCW95_01865 [Chryseobacterium sp.]|nr:hypothetical protein [Chryseobacterium sp.]
MLFEIFPFARFLQRRRSPALGIAMKSPQPTQEARTCNEKPGPPADYFLSHFSYSSGGKRPKF